MVRSQVLVSEITTLHYNLVSSQEDDEFMPTPPRPLEPDVFPLVGRDGDPVPSIVRGGDFQAEDKNDCLFVNHRSISDFIAERKRRPAHHSEARGRR